MKTKISPSLVGFFVLGFAALGLVALLSFGGVSFFSKPQRFIVYFDESIHGLDLGSPVKLRGVRVGRVVDLTLTYDQPSNHAVVAVTCELSRNLIRDTQGAIIDVSKREQLDDLVNRGMRAQLGVLGLATGLLFVELDFVDPKQYPADVLKDKPLLAVIPSMPSAISEFQASLTEILSGLKKVDFPGLSKELHGLLADTRRQINGLNLSEVSGNWSRAGKSVSELVEAPEIKQTVAALNTSIAQLTNTLHTIEAQVGPAGTKLNETLEEAKSAIRSFNEAAVHARDFIAAQHGTSEEATRAIMQLTEAAAAVQRLAEFIERNPNALLTGKKQP